RRDGEACRAGGVAWAQGPIAQTKKGARVAIGCASRRKIRLMASRLFPFKSGRRCKISSRAAASNRDRGGPLLFSVAFVGFLPFCSVAASFGCARGCGGARRVVHQ